MSEKEPKGRAERPLRDDRTGRAAAETRIQRQHEWVDQQIRLAMERGEFDNLEGAGKPIEGLGTDHDPNWWVKKLIEREQITILPPALALRKEDAELDDTLDRENVEKRVRDILDDFNRRVREAQRQLQGGPPVVTQQRDADAEVERWLQRRHERRSAQAAHLAQQQATDRSGRRRWRRRDRGAGN